MGGEGSGPAGLPFVVLTSGHKPPSQIFRSQSEEGKRASMCSTCIIHSSSVSFLQNCSWTKRRDAPRS